MYQSICHPHQVDPRHEQGAHPGHADCIEQGAAEGLVPVIGHHCQQETLRIGKDTEDQELQNTTIEGDSFVLSKYAHQHLRPNCCGIADITEGEVAEEKVHGCVQLGIHPNQDYHSKICQKTDEINKEKQL